MIFTLLQSRVAEERIICLMYTPTVTLRRPMLMSCLYNRFNFKFLIMSCDNVVVLSPIAHLNLHFTLIRTM